MSGTERFILTLPLAICLAGGTFGAVEAGAWRLLSNSPSLVLRMAPVLGFGLPVAAGNALPAVSKAVNSNLTHAAEQAAGRGVAPSVASAANGLRELSRQITASGFPAGTTRDTAHADRVLVPFGNAGYAVYQVAKNATAKLKTVLIAR